jgi:hypothetical protein
VLRRQQLLIASSGSLDARHIATNSWPDTAPAGCRGECTSVTRILKFLCNARRDGVHRRYGKPWYGSQGLRQTSMVSCTVARDCMLHHFHAAASRHARDTQAPFLFQPHKPQTCDAAVQHCICNCSSTVWDVHRFAQMLTAMLATAAQRDSTTAMPPRHHQCTSASGCSTSPTWTKCGRAPSQSW